MEEIAREIIKPSSPTPSHLRVYPLSFIDNLCPPIYVPLVFFYENQSFEPDDGDTTIFKVCEERSKLLKKSLSEVLAIYYPVAGRLKDRVSIECNDEGATFIVGHVKSKLSEILQDPKEEFLNPLFPDDMQWKEMDPPGSMVAVQVNHFDCGGMAISVCLSDKVGDASSMFNFIKDWASITTKSQVISPLFNGASVFPNHDFPVFPKMESGKSKSNTVCERFVFEASKIESLKAIVSQSVENPTRVQVVGAFIYKCAVSVLRSSSKCPYQLTTSTSLKVPVNLRALLNPPLPDKSTGNMFLGYNVSRANCTIEEELHESVRKIQEGLSEFCNKYAEEFGGKDMKFMLKYLKAANTVGTDENVILFNVTSWCEFAMYETDFGWGKPIWVTNCQCPRKNVAILMDAKDGEGIEALVTMEKQQIPCLSVTWNFFNMPPLIQALELINHFDVWPLIMEADNASTFVKLQCVRHQLFIIMFCRDGINFMCEGHLDKINYIKFIVDIAYSA